jgi:hypothetical protein
MKSMVGVVEPHDAPSCSRLTSIYGNYIVNITPYSYVYTMTTAIRYALRLLKHIYTVLMEGTKSLIQKPLQLLQHIDHP